MREGSIYCIQCLVPNTVIPLCPYNHSQQLEVGANETSTYPEGPSQGEENDYKRGVRETKRGGGGIPNTPEAPGKAPRILPSTNSIWLTWSMRNTVMVVVYTPKPNSLTHSLQIHCIGLAGQRLHASWT